ncbi:unnamed protein product, partial [Meganyctiphanes norvegica]
MDVCYPGFCGDNADCQTIGHRPICTCPPGTTGNPTIKCSALATERPPPPPIPIGETRPPPPDDPVIPDHITKTPPLSPEAQTTKRPPQPTIKPLPPTPILPVIEIACENNDDCEVDNSCINMMCLNSCSLNLCGQDANCHTVNHRPICVCPPGTTGDPQRGCLATTTDRITLPPPLGETTPRPKDPPINVGSGPSSKAPSPIADITTPKPEVYDTPAPPPMPVVPPIPVGCESSHHCPYENTCINRLCLNVCHPGLCGDDADCQTVGHRPSCLCPPGTTGNPTIKCTALLADVTTPMSPISGDQIIPPDSPINSGIGPSSTQPPPIIELPEEPTPPPQLPPPPPTPIVPSIAIACENNDECTSDNSCINNLCYDVCSLGICGTDADCKIHDHRPICTCPPGTTGDPLIKCQALLTERPTTVVPLGESSPIPSDPVSAGEGPSSTYPPPLAELP